VLLSLCSLSGRNKIKKGCLPVHLSLPSLTSHRLQNPFLTLICKPRIFGRQIPFSLLSASQGSVVAVRGGLSCSSRRMGGLAAAGAGTGGRGERTGGRGERRGLFFSLRSTSSLLARLPPHAGASRRCLPRLSRQGGSRRCHIRFCCGGEDAQTQSALGRQSVA
jgi:hypothetical protein